MVGLTCSQSLRFRQPYNYIMLFGFTAFLSFFVAVIVSRYDTLTVLIAVGIVSVMVMALSAFAMQTRIDFTLCHSLLFMSLIALIAMGAAPSSCVCRQLLYRYTLCACLRVCAGC